MAEGAVTSLLEQVKQILVEHRDLTSRAENEFELLVNELSVLKAIVMDVKGNTKNTHLFTELVRQVRDVVYDVEDAIDSCLAKAVEAKAKAKAKSSRKLVVPFFRSLKRLDLAKEINIVRTEKVLPLIEEAKKRFQNDFLGASTQDMEADDQWTTPIRDKLIKAERVVGLEDEEATITGYLTQETDRLDVIPIIGIPGQGKTTLAWKIFNNDDICCLFPIRIWAYISHKHFHLRNVYREILREVIPTQDTSQLTDEELMQAVRRSLEGGRFLLVLDNVWSVDVFHKINALLPRSNCKGKVLITSRDRDVGNCSSVCRKPHHLRFLRDDESWALLQCEVFGNVEECPQGLRGIGEIIAIKCDGVPLTIVVIGGILADRRRSTAAKEWETVMQNFSDFVQKEGAPRIAEVVALSYERLADDLRDCFVYLGVFPEDYEIPVEMLCWLWIAEEFISPKEGRSFEQTAEEMVNHLIAQNLLAVDKTDHCGNPKTCRVHDMIRAFCITKSKETNFFQEIGSSHHQLSATEVHRLHRLCLSNNISHFLSGSPTWPQIRSLLCFHEQPVELEPQVIPDGFPKLRILESKCIKFPQFPKVAQLIHLRYLTLSIDNLSVLPAALFQLWNLQTLIIQTSPTSIIMKANIWNMFRLQHLKTKAAIVLDSNAEGTAGENLQTLGMLSSDSCTEAVSKRVKNLNTLGISGKLADVFGANFLKHLERLEKLKLVNSSAHSHNLLSLPETNCFPPTLKKLTLRNTNLDWKHMPILAMLKGLDTLKLKDNAFVGVSWNAAGYEFLHLQLLLIVTTDLYLWEASSDSFPSLRVLVVKNCENLKEIPECLGTRLHKLEIERLRKSAVESAKKIEEIIKGNDLAVQFNLQIGPKIQEMVQITPHQSPTLLRLLA